MPALINKLVYMIRFPIRCISSVGRTKPEFDLNYLCDSNNSKEIDDNVHKRKGVGNIAELLKIYQELKTAEINSKMYEKLNEKFIEEASKIPNRTHPAVSSNIDEPRIVRTVNGKPKFTHEPYEFAEIARKLKLMRTEQLGNTSGHRSYYFMSDLAELEEALIKYSLSILLKKGFRLVSVPDILPSHILESCGMKVNNDRTQIYSLDADHHGPEMYLSGTAEMALAGLLSHSTYKEKQLPLKLAAVSRCYRAETSNVAEQRGIYRVHQFTKVEMFAVTTPSESEEMLENFLKIEEESFSALGLHMQVLDMPPKELGAPAYRKYDIEAWLPGRQIYGEISSCSNCTDYQSRRLHIKYKTHDDSKTDFVHSLNGTACAIPRMLIALIETHQKPNGKIEIPRVLRPFMSGKEYISKTKHVPDLKLYKIKSNK